MIRITDADIDERFRALIDAAIRGEEVVITVDDGDQEHTVKIVVIDEPPARRKPILGGERGKIWMSDDFDEPGDLS